jgi:deoxyadenosine/deoxycytidine kinase
MKKIITLLGLPGAGKTTYLKNLPKNSSVRYEPTDDLEALLKTFSPYQINNLFLKRFIDIDLAVPDVETHYLDSDYYTSLMLFGGEPELGSLPNPASELIYLKINPETQKSRILTRNRSFAQEELKYCEQDWHKKIEMVFDSYPCLNKTIIETT